MDNISAWKDLLDGEQEKALHLTIDTAACGLKELPPSSLDFLVHSSLRARTSAEVVDLMLALIRTQYLQARPPQQIKELENLFEKIIESQRGVITSSVTSARDKEVGSDGAAVDLSSIREKFTSSASATCSCCSEKREDEPLARRKVLGGCSTGMKEEDLDGVGNKTENDGKVCMKIVTAASCGNASTNVVEVGGSGTSCKQEEKCSSSSIIVSNAGTQVLRGLYDVTIGYPPPPPPILAAEGDLREKEEEDKEEQSFLHPPIQYRIAFAKYIIKQLELSRNWSAPQGSNEENVEDSDEQDTSTLLEKWYDGLESLSNSSSRQVLSEPFYRLYEIKVAHHNHKGSHETSENSRRLNAKHGIVKIFEHETSFVADGTTGLVTWKASIEFLKWLMSSGKDGGKWLLEMLGEEKDLRWILELGCGCGFLAIAMCKCVPEMLQQFIATDGSLAALEKAKLNVDANFSGSNERDKVIKSRIRFEKVDWQNEATRESFTQLVDGMTCIYGAGKGLLIGADIVFDPALIPDLVTLVADFLEAKAGRVILSCTIRNLATMEALKTKLASSQLSIRICGKWEDGEILEITLS